MRTLNEKRISNCSDTNHVKVQKLETMLSRLNKNRGLGFVAGGIVLDKTFLFGSLAKMSSVFVAGMSYMLALRPRDRARYLRTRRIRNHSSCVGGDAV